MASIPTVLLAIERALYALKNDTRDDARRIIIFMTDGIVDTGNPQTDVSRADWLRDDLASDAARAGIQIFGIAFTNAADFQLIQSLANKTGGDYFRALEADDLSGVFERINAAIIREAEPEPESEPASAAPQPPQQVIQAPAPEPIIIEVPSKSEELSREERTRNLILIVAAGVLCLTVLAILIVLIRRGRAGREPEAEYEPKAYLSDIHGVTEKQSYQLGRKPTMLGRVAGTDKDHLNYVVIPETTIGRRHALIEYKDYAYWIIDQGSINGTYVNDHIVNTETRLKHGDRIRLHKFEFEFVMPEMFDSGMTVVSNTVYARDIASNEEASQPVVADGGEDDSGNFDRLFDIDSSDDSSPSSGRITLSEDNYGDGEDATIQYDDDREAGVPQPAEPTPDPDEEDEDVTLTPGTGSGRR
ncbi:MAG: FHA domain-containing protein [Gammaproteobacteria bacterium]|nr:FHA domain-containing protein [Gammaproteobacteria bacterium]